MSSRTSTPRTGLAARMRGWMSGQKRSFTAADVSDALGIDPGKDRERVATVIYDFVRRGEITREPEKRNRRQNTYRYRYNQAWRKATSMPIAGLLYKAMYVNGRFTMAAIRKQAGYKETGYVGRIVKDLLDRGMIQIVGRQRCAHGAGAERIYNIPNRDKFRLEVMK